MKHLMLFLCSVIAIAAMSFPTPAASEEVTRCPDGTPRGTICLEQIDIFGDVHEPNAVFVINRDRLVHQRHHDDQSFTDDVVESVDRAPF